MNPSTRAHPWRRWLGVALLAALAGCRPDAPGVEPGRRNVVLVVVDTLRADRLGCYGAGRETSPSIDRLAAQGVRYERAYSVSPWTMPTVATLFTGLFPRQHAVTGLRDDLADAHLTLAEAFAGAGYNTAAVISHYLIGRRHGFDQGFETFDEEEAQGHDYLSTPGVARRARERLLDLARDDRPFFLFVHFFDPHYLYLRHDEFGFAPPTAGRLTGEETMRALRAMEPTMTAREGAFLRDLYDEEIRFTDDGIGLLLETIDELDLRDAPLVVLTADHGEEFLDHGRLGHTRTLYEELTHVPLIVRGAGVAVGAVDRAPVSLVDLPAVLLDWAGLDPERFANNGAPWTAALGEPSSRPAAPVFCEVDFEPVAQRFKDPFLKKSIVDGERKLILDEHRASLELFDLAKDPLEQRPSSNPDGVVALEARLREWMARTSEPVFEAEPSTIDAEERARLEALGYVGP